ncbi:MAG: hypothetical protein DME00_19945 [Candidatus Rokuibacteriota bacterium]|nr:MAG: hypothetical protein DME00_19945 [Candidatus Rokubacteria bacterium]PYO07915.1 MAG: hypothetical protein DMD75_19660 [Candidatus Rokubacteria bacterium]
MAERYFTVADVEALIPELARIMEPVMSAHAEVSATQERMQAEQQRIAMAGGGVLDRRAWRADKDKVERLTGEIRRGLGEIVELGGAPKDLGLGLVDFLHLRDGREVNLCWRYGEREIRHWHGLDEGYAGRKPL